jgi:uncharacterized protein YegP (UPF0339 family)
MAKGDYTEVFKGADDQWYWHRRAANNRNIATGGEGFVSEANAERAAHRAFPDDEVGVLPIWIWGLILLVALYGAILLGRYIESDSTPSRPVPVTTTTIESQPTTTESSGHTGTTVDPTTTVVAVGTTVTTDPALPRTG